MNKPLVIGHLPLASPILLAPMAGYSDLTFRLAIRALGGLGLAFTEMLDPRSVLYGGGRKRKALLATSPMDRPLGYQIYGSDATLMAEAARWLADQGATVIDINMGCPQKKISRRGSGGGLLRNPSEAIKLASQIVKAVTIPVTAKLRSGWEEGRHTAVALAPALEEVGIAAITIHGRTCLQGFNGKANWEDIGQVAASVHRIPVIGNGDITTPAEARTLLTETGCAGIMIGRAVLKHPWIIREVHAVLVGRPIPTLSWGERMDFMRQHFEAMVAQHGECNGVLLFRRWIPQYSKGLNLGRPTMISLLQIRDAGHLRQRLNDLSDMPQRGNPR